MTPRNLEILQHLDLLPPSAIVPIEVVAMYRGISEKTARRIYRTVAVSERRLGVRRGDLDQPREIRGRGRPRKQEVAVSGDAS